MSFSIFKIKGDHEKALKTIEEKEALDKSLDELMEELEEIGGGDSLDDFAENTAKVRFETIINGEDRGKLQAYTEIKGYLSILSDLDKAKAELEKKQSGE